MSLINQLTTSFKGCVCFEKYDMHNADERVIWLYADNVAPDCLLLSCLYRVQWTN